MRVKAKSRIVVAWLLFMTLMPLFVVKAVHHHGESETVVCQSSDGEHSHNPCDQCPVCQFALSPFAQAEAFHAEIIVSVRLQIRLSGTEHKLAAYSLASPVRSSRFVRTVIISDVVESALCL